MILILLSLMCSGITAEPYTFSDSSYNYDLNVEPYVIIDTTIQWKIVAEPYIEIGDYRIEFDEPRIHIRDRVDRAGCHIDTIIEPQVFIKINE
jgi:hypothetical protein